jgi:hypothetical protein
MVATVGPPAIILGDFSAVAASIKSGVTRELERTLANHVT